MSIKTEYTFREPEVTCTLTRQVKSKCVTNKQNSHCIDCLKVCGIANERLFDTKTGGTVILTECKVKDGKLQPIVRNKRKMGRNEPCTCGSGKKWKVCCGK